MKYNWAAYYQKAYEAEKKKNTVLAGKVADAEKKREELQEKYAAICRNPLYQFGRLFSLGKRGVRKIVCGAREVVRRGSGTGKDAQMLLASYEKRLASQIDRYGQWIQKEEPALWREGLETLQAKRGTNGKKRCLIVSYQALAGVKSLSQIKGIEKGADILLFAECAEDLDKQAVSYIEDWFAAYPETKLFYGAEDYRIVDEKGNGRRVFPWFKPCWSPDTLLGFFYFGSYFALDGAWAQRTPLSGYETAKENLYDFILRLLMPYYGQEKQMTYGGRTEDALEKNGIMPQEIAHTDLILYHRSDAAAFATAQEESFLYTGEMRKGFSAAFWGCEKEYIKIKQNFINNICYLSSFAYQTFHPEVWSVVPEMGEYESPKENILVSVVIPSKDHPELLAKCIRSFWERTSLQNLHGAVEFIIVDNGSSEENRKAVQAFLESEKIKDRYLYQPMAFNFSAMCNRGVKEANGAYILLLNDDMEIIEENWLRILMGQAMLPGVGAVGAKLWYPEGERIQHTGVTNMRIGPSHKLVTFPDDKTYYYGQNTVVYDKIAVTAACLLVKKSVYEEVGGLDEELAVSYNDVAFCLKLEEAGYRNVVRNDAVLLHHESASRGADGASARKWQRLLQEKAKLYKKHPLFYERDPYYNRQLAGDSLGYFIGYQYPYEKRCLMAEAVRKNSIKSLQKILSAALMLTVERAEQTPKIYLEEPDILEIEGWCYLSGQDNAVLERWLILEAEQGGFYYQISVKERLRPDVEAILPQQKHIALSGFVCRVEKQKLAFGSYIVGMLYRHRGNGKSYYQRSKKTVLMKKDSCEK